MLNSFVEIMGKAPKNMLTCIFPLKCSFLLISFICHILICWSSFSIYMTNCLYYCLIFFFINYVVPFSYILELFILAMVANKCAAMAKAMQNVMNQWKGLAMFIRKQLEVIYLEVLICSFWLEREARCWGRCFLARYVRLVWRNLMSTKPVLWMLLMLWMV